VDEDIITSNLLSGAGNLAEDRIGVFSKDTSRFGKKDAARGVNRAGFAGG
jgi:hypothetical protein